MGRRLLQKSSIRTAEALETYAGWQAGEKFGSSLCAQGRLTGCGGSDAFVDLLDILIFECFAALHSKVLGMGCMLH